MKGTKIDTEEKIEGSFFDSIVCVSFFLKNLCFRFLEKFYFHLLSLKIIYFNINIHFIYIQSHGLLTRKKIVRKQKIKREEKFIYYSYFNYRENYSDLDEFYSIRGIYLRCLSYQKKQIRFEKQDFFWIDCVF